MVCDEKYLQLNVHMEKVVTNKKQQIKTQEIIYKKREKINGIHNLLDSLKHN